MTAPTVTTADPPPRLTWRDRLLAHRDRLLADPRFQRWAASFPLTRGIAQRQARTLFDVAAGFVYSQVLLACVRVELMQRLSAGPLTLSEIAARTDLPLAGADRLVRAAIALGLVERRSGGRFGLGMRGAALLGNPGISAFVEHHTMLYADLRDPVALLRGRRSDTALAQYWPYAGNDAPDALASAEVAPYSVLMAASQPMICEDVLDAYDVRPHARILDVAGGEGAFLQAVAARAPHLQLTLFDLPAVAERARTRLAAAGLGSRTTTVGGDLFRDALPGGADLISLVRVAHDHDDDALRAILSSIHRAIAPGGTLLLAEPLAETPGAEPVGDAYFGFYLLAMGRGRPRSAAELTQFLRAAGFDEVRAVPTRRPLLTSLITARSIRNRA